MKDRKDIKDKICELFYHFFLKHPHDKKISYLQHMVGAVGILSKLVVIIIVLLVHAIIPGIWETTGSTMIHALSQQLIKREEDEKKDEKEIEKEKKEQERERSISPNARRRK